ncbi:MAG: PaaI family thioesterase [Rhodobacteraceae bacterium]|nr:PaaI family thioesterase [Paracoccaceae bacterium]
MDLKMNIPDLNEFIKVEFPQIVDEFEIREISKDSFVLGLMTSQKHLRPGDTVSGPTMFALCDVTSYIGLLAILGPVSQSVTTNCSIDFMRRPEAGLLVCRANVLKLGKRLAVFDGCIYSGVLEEKPVARFSVTYAIQLNN